MDDCTTDNACLSPGPTKVSYADAKKYCTDNSGSLIEISDKDDYDFVWNFLKATKLKAAVTGYDEYFWTDLYWENVSV